MRRSPQFAPLALLLLCGAVSAPAVSEEMTPEARDALERSIPRPGLITLTDAAYRKLRDMMDEERRRDPKAERLFSLQFTDIQSAPSREAAEKGEWSKSKRSWVLGMYEKGQMPDAYVQTIRGLRFLVVYQVETWRAARKQTIDFQPEGFVLAAEER